MKFCDYVTAYQQLKRIKADGSPSRDFQDFYESYMDRFRASDGDFNRWWRAHAECFWYVFNRPFFNVYPSVVAKLLSFDANVSFSELWIPCDYLEIRTCEYSLLAHNRITKDHEFDGFHVIRFQDGRHQSFTIDPDRTLSEFTERSHPSKLPLIRLVAGVCMLAQDKEIVTPVILNKDRRDNMTPDEVAKYAEKAINRTGRIGFDVGREMERNPSSMHYRNGCFAKYYVGPDHELYPPKADKKIVPVIKWRSGTTVNKDRLKVPTGFKDQPTAQGESDVEQA